MTDLVQEFFTRDLSEVEHEALSKLLEGSPEATARYEGLLQQNYLATGLPQPTLPHSLQSLPHVGGGGMTIWGGGLKILLAGLVAGAALWKFWPQPKVEGTLPQTAQQVTFPKPSVASLKMSAHKPAPIEPSALNPAQEGQELSVLVDAPQKALVTVRILDAGGREVRALYTGFVQAGRWNFTWDGLLENGRSAGPGDYRIDVQTGAAHQTKDIRIKLGTLSP
jgi:hypothetical protein